MGEQMALVESIKEQANLIDEHKNSVEKKEKQLIATETAALVQAKNNVQVKKEKLSLKQQRLQKAKAKVERLQAAIADKKANNRDGSFSSVSANSGSSGSIEIDDERQF